MPTLNSIGCSTWCLMDRSLEEALDVISSLTGCAEILSDSLHSLFLSEEACHSFDLQYTVHAPTGDVNYHAPLGRGFLLHPPPHRERVHRLNGASRT
ncbi:MAG: hypothetical protein PWQ46_1518 [Methanomicrobiaceae archaeon]|nr:hypothetical protein [Methanomicrobiaceae archaeon]